MNRHWIVPIAALGCLLLANPSSSSAVELGDSIVFSWHHKGVRGCKKDSAIKHGEAECKRRFNLPDDSEIALIFISFKDRYFTTGWPFGADYCYYDAQVACEVEYIP